MTNVGPAEALVRDAIARSDVRINVNTTAEALGDRARKIDAQLAQVAALRAALEAVERWFTPRSELVEPYEELLWTVREALRSVKEGEG